MICFVFFRFSPNLRSSAFICGQKLFPMQNFPLSRRFWGPVSTPKIQHFFPKFLNLHNFYNVWLNQINRNADIDIGKVF